MFRLFVLTILLLAACDAARTTPEPTGTDAPTPTLTPAATATPEQVIVPVTPEEPIPSPTPTCENAPSTRLIVNERGQVMSQDPRPLNVRSGPGTGFRILGRLEVLDVFRVLDGPRCGGGYVWYLVERDDLQGWIAEGDSSQYYVEPYLPG